MQIPSPFKTKPNNEYKKDDGRKMKITKLAALGAILAVSVLVIATQPVAKAAIALVPNVAKNPADLPSPLNRSYPATEV